MAVYSVNVYPSSTTIQKNHWYYDAYAVVSASADCYKDVEWYSDRPSVATVNESNGYIFGCSSGVAKIYARSKFDRSKEDYIIVHVTNDPICVESVSLDASNFSIRKGRQFVLSATVYPENASNKSIAWSSSDQSVATVSEGVVTAKSKGDAYIRAVAKDGSGMYDSCYVKVTEDILVSSVTVSPSSHTMTVGQSICLCETVCPGNATNQCVKWSSNKTSVATVNPDTGLVIAQGVGTAKIRATARDGSGKYGECTITVKAPVAVTGVEVYPTSLTMNVGDTDYLCKTVYPSNATNQTVTWSSSNENVATVGLYTGKISANMAGTTTITATTADGGYQDCIIVRVVEAYINHLENSCGFSSEEANLIRKLYDKVDLVFSSESVMLRAWRCARVLSEFHYDYLIYGMINQWDDVAGSVTTEESRKTYFLNTLGYTENEYNTLNDALLRNKGDADKYHNIIDFTHMQYALSARLAYTLNKDSNAELSNIFSGLYTGNYGIYTDEDVSYLGGWLGDAVLTKIYGQGTTAMKNEDYMADLDAENIYCLIVQGNSSIDAINKYYSNMTSSNTRASMFLKNIPYNTVKEKIFYELIDAELYVLMSNASNQGEILMTQYYLGLINNEQYHFDTIKSRYPDTYDFLKSLNDRLSTMVHYQ